MFTKRGVKSYWFGTELGHTDEDVCLCKCHVEHMLHFVACCHAPKTEEGKTLLEAYNKDNPQ